MANPPEFSGEIRVASRIVDYLSSGLYKSPAACLKELINNSFDADATHVNVFVKPDADRIIIEDNGSGMDQADFVRHFSVISESHKRDEQGFTPTGRPKIGKIGIGFIAANEICDVMQLVSTKAGSSELLDVTIHFDLMRQDPIERKREGTSVAKADYVGTVSETDKSEHFTQIFLKQVRGEAQSILSGVGTSEFASGEKSFYGLKPESILKKLKKDNFRTWSVFDAYTKNLLEVGLNVPVRYHDQWVPTSLRSRVKEFEDHVASLDFSVSFDGTDLRKPIVYKPSGRSLVSKFEYSGENVGATGYFYAQHGAIRPQELQGVLIRIRNAAVGEYDSSFLGFSSSIGSLFQTWISGEIMADDRLEEAMNIDRRTLRDAHPAYIELQRAIHAHLANLIKRVRLEIYEDNKADRSVTRAEEMKARIIEIASREIDELAPNAAKNMKRVWKKVADTPSDHRMLLRKRSVDELYTIVIETAKEVLPPKLMDEFISRLTDRLLR